MDDYFFNEEIIFPEEGGVTGQRSVNCPNCGTAFELDVDSGNTDDRYQCSSCDSEFSVNWVAGTVSSFGGNN
jgi:hypothetical protein